MIIHKKDIKKDAYKNFFEHYKIDFKELTEFAISEIIFADKKDVKSKWIDIKNKFEAKNPMPIRKYGQNGSKNKFIRGFYLDCFGIEVKFDTTNNQIPTKTLQDYTGKRKNFNIFNYQVSHIFSKTKNIFLFDNLFNLGFIPKYIDPFSGHESFGERKEEFQKILRQHVCKLYGDIIRDYNSYVSSLDTIKKINHHIDMLKLKGSNNINFLNSFKETLIEDFKPIEIEI